MGCGCHNKFTVNNQPIMRGQVGSSRHYFIAPDGRRLSMGNQHIIFNVEVFSDKYKITYVPVGSFQVVVVETDCEEEVLAHLFYLRKELKHYNLI